MLYFDPQTSQKHPHEVFMGLGKKEGVTVNHYFLFKYMYSWRRWLIHKKWVTTSSVNDSKSSVNDSNILLKYSMTQIFFKRVTHPQKMSHHMISQLSEIKKLLAEIPLKSLTRNNKLRLHYYMNRQGLFSSDFSRNNLLFKKKKTTNNTFFVFETKWAERKSVSFFFTFTNCVSTDGKLNERN